MNKKEKSQKNGLMTTSSQLESSLVEFRDINQKASFIALNAAIEGARMRGKLATFSIVAEQISKQASKNSELSEKLAELVQRIRDQSLDAVAIRNLELSADLIDKLDRNLFERNCDVQAWATFDVVKQAILNPSLESAEAAAEQLEKLVSIYMVYADSLLIDLQGSIITAAKAKNLNGTEVNREPWFAATVAGNVTVTDVILCPRLKRHVVLYCSPVTNDEGAVIGVLANHFDWTFALEMIASADFSKNTEAVVINKNGQVIAGKRESQILFDTYDWLRGGEISSQGGVGYSIEKARNGEPIAVGYTHTKGYNAYKGKGWSAIIAESVGHVNAENRAIITNLRTGSNPELEIERGGPAKQDSEIDSEVCSSNLLKTMKEVDDLVFQINGNNREVKLLAVNASIQAGLAGAEGEGFSIIANEVAMLAKKSLRFVESVNDITSRLHKAVDESSSLRVLDAAKDTMSKIDRNLFERYCDIQAWATFSKIIDALSSGERADAGTLSLLEKIHKIYEVYHDIYILNLDGKLVGSAINHALIGSDFSQKDWFTQAKNGNLFFSTIYVSETLKQPLMSFSSPVYDANHKIVGVMASKFNCNFLNDILRASIIDSKSDIYLVNQAGMVIASRNTIDVYQKSLAEIPVFSTKSDTHYGLLEHKEKNQSFTVGFSHSKGYNSYPGQRWCLITSSPTSGESRSSVISAAERFRQRLVRGKAV